MDLGVEEDGGGASPNNPYSKQNQEKIFACGDIDTAEKYHVEGSYDGRISLAMMIAMLVLGFVTFFVNLGVIIRTIKILRRGHDNKPAFYFIGNLALSDLAIGLYIIIAFLLHITNKSDLWQQKSCTLQIGVAVTACQETIFSIMLIAVDKYLYICHALKYHQIVTMTRVYVAVTSTWVISLIIGSLPAMGMVVEWEDTCGRCIFAQVISTDFAILLFVTAVALPFAVVVSLYSILLILAIKIQKARCGGTYNTKNSGRTSYFRLSFMSTKSTKSSKSTTSTFKSTSTTKSTISTTASTCSDVSISKTNRRRMRRQAMQEYKSSLPGLNEVENTAKLLHVRNSNTKEKLNDQTEIVINGKAWEDQEGCNKNETSLRQAHLQESDKTKHIADDTKHRAMIHENDTAHNNFMKTHTSDVDTLMVTTEEVASGVKNNIATDLTVADVNHVQESNVDVNGVACKKNISNTDSIINEDKEEEHPHPSPPPHDACLTVETNSPTAPKVAERETSISSRNLPSLTSTDEDEDDDNDNQPDTFMKRWSLSKYFNRVVTDTRDKVLFLKKCQAVKTIFLIIGSFTATYVPFVVGSLVYSVEKEKNKRLLQVLQTLLYCAVVANSLANPLMYAYGYREFRIRSKKFKGVFAREKQPKL